METIIQFIGLIVFATRVGGGGPVVAILPRVTGPPAGPAMQRMQEHAARLQSTDAQSPLDPTVIASDVESHTALFTFAACDLIAVKGWELKALGDKNYLYIPLNGEHLTVTTDVPNAPVTPSDSKDLGVAQLGGTLADAYTARSNYSGAAGIVTLTRGTLSTCGNPRNNEEPGRVDMRLSLQAKKWVTISAGQKSITLRAGGRYYVGNVPTAALREGYRMTGSFHYAVYCAMTGRNCDEIEAKLRNAGSGNACPESPVSRLASSMDPEVVPIPPDWTMRVDFACSNSSYP